MEKTHLSCITPVGVSGRVVLHYSREFGVGAVRGSRITGTVEQRFQRG